MSFSIAHPDAQIEISPIGGGCNALKVVHKSGVVSNCVTSYPKELIEAVLAAKSPAALVDEIARDEDPLYVRICLEKDLFAYVSPEDFRGKRVLDFGCGAGGSTMNLARMLPESELVGIDLSGKLLSVAKARASHYGLRNVAFIESPSGQSLPDGIGEFDFILFSAVYEHLLPTERPVLLPKVWSLLKPDGVLFLDQTPWRWFPFEGHTSGLSLTNYLPARLAYLWARRFSRRGLRNESWENLLRSGIRGGSVREIMAILGRCTEGQSVLLKPSRLGIGNRVDLWYAGYAVSIARKYPWAARIQRVLKCLFKAVYLTTGLVITPSLSLAIRKG